MSPIDCERCADAAPYVLRAMDDAEGLAFARHLGACPVCHEQVLQLQGIADTLPLAAPSIPAPPAVKSRLMAIVASEAELLQAAGPDADRFRAERAATTRKGWRRRVPHLGRLVLRPPVAAGLTCALLALGTGAGLLAAGNDASGPSSRTLPAPSPVAANATLIVTGDKGTLHLVGMQAPASGQTYQVWLRKQGSDDIVPTHTLFNVRSDGRANVAIDESVKGVAQVLVTQEPNGGSEKPSGQPVITATPS